MPASDLLVPVQEGEILAGKYRVDRILGSGGMGVVVAATHIELGQHVAIKFLLPAALGVPGARERFTREARAAATLRSDHVARVVDVGTLEDGAPYMIMEFLDGCDLGQLLVKSGPLRVDEAVGFVLQACDAVSEAHASGIVHRDLKPGNLFLTRKANGAPHIKVLDFGISKSTRVDAAEFSLTKTSDVIGSPIYMAPEQIRSARDVDERTDIWALGVILYELLTGRVPFPAQNVPQLCAMVLEQQPVPVATWRPEIPFELASTVARCLQKDPADRFSSIGELMRALFPFAPAPAASGLVRSVAPSLSHSASIGSLERPSQEWGETLAGPPPPTAPPRVIGIDVGSTGAGAPKFEPSAPGIASVTLQGAPPEARRAAPVAIVLVVGLLVVGVALAGAAVWSSRAYPPEAPSSSAVVLPSALASAVPSADPSSPIAVPFASAPAIVASDLPVEDLPARTARPAHGTVAAPPRTAPTETVVPPAATTTPRPPGTDFLPDERK